MSVKIQSRRNGVCMYYIGIDLGGTNIAAGIVNEDYKIIAKGSVPTLAEREGSAIVDDMANLCAGLVKDAGLTFDDIHYAGIASPGTCDSDRGVVLYANNLPFFQFPISEMLRARIPLKNVYIENDANAAAKGESVAGAAKGSAYSVFITLGTGVGGGVVVNGSVYSGFNFAGAELGHMVIVYNGRQCSCGRRGCWESYSSATGLVAMTKEKMQQTDPADTIMWQMCDNSLNNISGKTAFAAARQGDSAGQAVVDMYINYLACGITNIINIFQPEILSIGGGISNERDYLLKPLIKHVRSDEYGSSTERARTEIKIAELGNDAGIIGAALLKK
jgi:glucokinase